MRLELVRAGDPAAVKELYDWCVERLGPYFRRHLPEDAEVADFVHEAFTRAVEGIRAGATPDEPERWLFGIARVLRARRLQEKYRRDDSEVPEDRPVPVDHALELERPLGADDLPESPTDVEMLRGKEELWATMRTAMASIGEGLRRILTAHIDLSLRHQREIKPAELAAELGIPASQVHRQLSRARLATADSVAALVLARTPGCAELTSLLGSVLSAEQLEAGRKITLEARQAAKILGHSEGCPACRVQAQQAKEYARWALGPGLVGLADDDERRRAVLAFFSQSAEGRVLVQPAASVLAAEQVVAAQNAAEALPDKQSRVTAAASWVQQNPVLQPIAQIVTEHPMLVRVVGGVAAVVVALGALVASAPQPRPGDEHVVAAPPPVTAPSSTPNPVSPVAQPEPLPPTGQPVAPQPSPRPQTPNPTQPAPSSQTPGPVVPVTNGPTTSPTTTTAPTTTAPTTTAPTTTAPTTTTTATTTTTTTRAEPVAAEVTVDARDTSYPTIIVTGVQYPATAVHTLKLKPGNNFLTTPGGHLVPFRVDQDMTVHYEPKYETVFDGEGTRSLVVHGLPTTFDMRDTTYSLYAIAGTTPGWIKQQDQPTLKLLPGKHVLTTSTPISANFTVGVDGTLDFPATQDSFFTGRGGRQLVVHGLPIRVDARATAYLNYAHAGGQGWLPNNREQTLRLIPGRHTFNTPSNTPFVFTVTTSGDVTFDAGLGTFLEASGALLTVKGLPVGIDLSGTSYRHFLLSGATNYLPTSTGVRLLPGVHAIVTPAANSVRFRVLVSGALEHDPSADNVLDVVGTTLVVRGLPVRFDASDTSYPVFVISGVTGHLKTNETHELLLLPGGHGLVSAVGAPTWFTVTASGQLDYDAVAEPYLDGRGGTLLTVHGVEIAFDATGAAFPSWQANAVTGWLPSAQVHRLRLLPGGHTVTPFGRAAFRITITPDGTLAYDTALDTSLTGRGSRTLRF